MRVLTHRPNQVMTTTFRYVTDIQTRKNGTEYRESKSDNIPGRNYSFQYRLDEEETVAEELAMLVNFNEDIKIPLYYEEYTLNDTVVDAQVPGKYYLNPGDEVILVDYDAGLHHITTIASTHDDRVVLTDAVTRAFPEGSSLMPLETVKRWNDPQIQRHTRNAANLLLQFESTKFRPVSGALEFATFDGIPRLETRPLQQGIATETYSNRNRITRYSPASPFHISSTNIYPVKKAALSYVIEGREQLEKFKSAINYLQGMFREIYIPTYRHNLIYQPSNTNTNLIGFDNSENIGFNWKRGQAIFLEYGPDANREYQFMKIEGVRINSPSGTAQLISDTQVSQEVLSSEGVKLGFLERCRLDNDGVELNYSGGDDINIRLAVSTIPEPFLPITVHDEGPDDGKYGDKYEDRYD